MSSSPSVSTKPKILPSAFHSGVWNAPDNTLILVASSFGLIAVTVGILGILGHRGRPLGQLKIISQVLSKEFCALSTGVGGALVTAVAFSIVKKGINSLAYYEAPFLRVYKDPQLLSPNVGLYNKNYEVIHHSEKEDHIVRTNQEVHVFSSIEPLIAYLRQLEQKGYHNSQALTDVASAPTVPLLKEAQEGHFSHYCIGLGIALISLPAFVVPFFYSFRYASTLQTAGLGVILAVFYGIVNDQLAFRQSKHYFTLGHTQIHKRLLKTDDPTANGIIWGIHATWFHGVLAGVVLAMVATIKPASAGIKPLYLTPVAITATLVVNIYAHVKSKIVEEAYCHPVLNKELNEWFNTHEIDPLDPTKYDTVYLCNVPEEERPAWEGVGTRNHIGYKLMPLLAGVLSIGIIAARILLLKVL